MISTLFTAVGLLMTAALLTMLLVTLHNWLAFPRLKLGTQTLKPHQPGVSILVPARNEAKQIGKTVAALLNQEYANFELLVLDDHSDDQTATVATAAAGNDPRFRLMQGEALPNGWTGKNWACHQLAAAAQHDLLLFTDADVQWQPQALPALVVLQQTTQADLLTVWPTQITQTWGERLVVPLMSFAIWAYLPIWLVHHTPFSSAAAANGQCLLFRRAAYARCGGHESVRERVLDDVLLAQRVKATGGRLRMADGTGLILCRMYEGWQQTLHGYAKNILAGHNNSPTFLIASTLFHLLIFVGPWIWLIYGLVIDPFHASQWPLRLVQLSLLPRIVTAFATRQRIGDAFFMPISVLLMTQIAIQSLWWHWHAGGPQWKGRTLPNA